VLTKLSTRHLSTGCGRRVEGIACAAGWLHRQRWLRMASSSSSPNDLQRVPDYQYMNKAITIYTQCALQGPAPGYQPDEILWHGSQFIVRALDDYSGYGNGWLMVIALSIDHVDPAPPMPAPLGSA
jgi:hypothetical protein